MPVTRRLLVVARQKLIRAQLGRQCRQEATLPDTTPADLHQL